MTQGKSLLNPYATPYIPVWKLASGTGDVSAEQHTEDLPETSMELLLPELVDYDDARNFACLNSREPTIKMGQHEYYSYDTHPDELGELDGFILKLDSLSSLFPDISVEYLAELLDAHQGDLQETIGVMQQFESDGDGSEFLGLADTSHICNLASQTVSSSVDANEAGSTYDLASNCSTETAVEIASKKLN